MFQFIIKVYVDGRWVLQSGEAWLWDLQTGDATQLSQGYGIRFGTIPCSATTWSALDD